MKSLLPFRESLSSALDTKDNKLVLFIPADRKFELRDVLHKKLSVIDPDIRDEYRLHIVQEPIEITPEYGGGKYRSGTKLCYYDKQKRSRYASCGVFLKDDDGHTYMISSCHGSNPKECYILETDPSSSVCSRHRCKRVEHVYQTSPLLDAVLFEVDTQGVTDLIDPLLGSPFTNSALCGLYTDASEDINKVPGKWITVEKYGGSTKTTKGEVSLYDFQHPPSDITDALVIRPVDPENAFSEAGDSGALVYRVQPHNHAKADEAMTNLSLHEGIAVLCHGLKGVEPKQKWGVAFRLDDAIGHFKEKMGKSLHLLPFDHSKDMLE